MIEIRLSDERGHAQHGWLDSRFTFSFADYDDPKHVQFRSLRVINEDHVAPGRGFGMHPHRDMEIITYILEGAIEHRDNMGNRGVIRPGEIQKMSAGTGILHSEFNPSQTQPAHLLQIWIMPDKRGIKPTYEEHKFAPDELDGQFQPVAGPNATVTIQQDAELLAAKLKPGQKASHELLPERHGWLQVARGAGKVNGHPVKAGDGVAVSDETSINFEATEQSEVLLFDLG
ncbi:MAG: pirin family protein [Candidatus Acidiferrales bacterium]|jgi:redox-sensitive bicupin YhaK (pirin superfamily)